MRVFERLSHLGALLTLMEFVSPWAMLLVLVAGYKTEGIRIP